MSVSDVDHEFHGAENMMSLSYITETISEKNY